MKIISVIFVISIFVLTNLPLESMQRVAQTRPEDASLNFTGLAKRHGLDVREHDVTTEDGYILKLFHILGDKEKTVLLMHGILDSADSFILRGRGSLAVALAAAGYDVWLGNYRGTTYSRRHTHLDPDTDNEFWDFSFHEVGVYDLPALIDFILRENKVKRLSAVGHSQGNMIFYVLGAARPEYNDKIKVNIALGPAAFLNLENFQFPVTTVFETGPFINWLLVAMNQEEVLGQKSFLMFLKNNICTHQTWGYRLCAEGIFFQLAGEDADEFEPPFYRTLIEHYPNGTSRKNVLHLIQMATQKEFAPFDYGSRKNLELYNSTTPPAYALKNVTMKTALLIGRNDKITPLENVELLRKQLPNVVMYHVMEHPKFNHIDHMWGKNMHKYLFPHIMKLLTKYS